VSIRNLEINNRKFIS